MQHLKNYFSNAFYQIGALFSCTVLKKPNRTPALRACTLPQLAPALRNAIAAGTPLSTLNKLLCCPKADGNLLRIQFVRSRSVCFRTHPIGDPRSAVCVQKVPCLKLTIGTPTGIFDVHVVLHPSEDHAYTRSGVPAIYVNYEGSKNEVFKGPVLDVPLESGSSQFFCASPFLPDSSYFNDELLQRLVQLYVPDLPNLQHPFKDVKLRLGAKVDFPEYQGEEALCFYCLTVETPNISLPEIHSTCYQSRFYAQLGHKPALTSTKLKNFMRGILVPYTAYHLLKALPPTWQLLELLCPNPYEDSQSYRIVKPDFELFVYSGNTLYIDFDASRDLPPVIVGEESLRIVRLARLLDPLNSNHTNSETAPSALSNPLSYEAQKQSQAQSLLACEEAYLQIQLSC